MPTESDLRDRLLGDEPPRGRIDVDLVVRRARARRRPRLVAGAGIGVLAAGGILTPALLVGGIGGVGLGGMAASEEDAGTPDSIGEQGATGPADTLAGDDGGRAESGRGTLDDVLACAAPLGGPGPTVEGLATALPAIEATAGAPIPARVLLVNTGAEPLRGTVSMPVLALVLDGDVVGRAAPGTDAAPVAFDLDPGESVELATTVEPTACGASGRGVPLAPGDYELSAVVDVVLDSGESALAGGPSAPVRLD